MRVACGGCGRQLDIPDAKVPDRAFSVACPGCGERIAVDPTRAEPPAPAASSPSPSSSPAPENPAEAPELGPLRPGDRELLAGLTPVAYVAELAAAPLPPVDPALRAIGMDEIHRGDDLSRICGDLLETGAGVLVVHMDKAPPPPCPPLEPVYGLPADQRRRTFVALVADNVRSLDGQVAFYLQVNCLLSAREPEALAPRLRRAVLHHLRLYRHWDGPDGR